MRRAVLTLAVEDISAKALADGHAQVDIEADSGDAHAGVMLIFGQQERVVMVVMVVVVEVRVASVSSRMGLCRHGGRGEEQGAMGGEGGRREPGE